MSGSGRTRQRIPVEPIPVRYICEGSESVGHLEDVSRAGFFVRTAELPPEGAVVALQFLSPTGVLVDLRGLVKWSTEGHAADARPSGFGVLLHEPVRQYLEFLRWVLEQADAKKGDDPPSL